MSNLTPNSGPLTQSTLTRSIQAGSTSPGTNICKVSTIPTATTVSPVILLPFIERSVMMPAPLCASFAYFTGIHLLNRVCLRTTAVGIALPMIQCAHTVIFGLQHGPPIGFYQGIDAVAAIQALP